MDETTQLEDLPYELISLILSYAVTCFLSAPS
jgi:hypothetical protein